MKPVLKTYTQELTFWDCGATDDQKQHRHSTQAAAQRCIDSRLKKQDQILADTERTAAESKKFQMAIDAIDGLSMSKIAENYQIDLHLARRYIDWALRMMRSQQDYFDHVDGTDTWTRPYGLAEIRLQKEPHRQILADLRDGRLKARKPKP